MSDRVTAYTQLPGGWFLNNAGWFRGTDRVLLVDTWPADPAATEHGH